MVAKGQCVISSHETKASVPMVPFLIKSKETGKGLSTITLHVESSSLEDSLINQLVNSMDMNWVVQEFAELVAARTTMIEE